MSTWSRQGSNRSLKRLLQPDCAYNVPADKVLGLRLEQDSNGAYLPEYKKDYPFTYGSGKPELIHKEISGKHEGRAL
jgi:hypothetical protein